LYIEEIFIIIAILVILITVIINKRKTVIVSKYKTLLIYTEEIFNKKGNSEGYITYLLKVDTMDDLKREVEIVAENKKLVLKSDFYNRIVNNWINLHITTNDFLFICEMFDRERKPKTE
jgi:hypothetical protein